MTVPGCDKAMTVEAQSKDQPQSKSRNRPGGAPRGNRNALTHGFNHYKRLISSDGLKRSTSLYRALREKEQELVSALGSDPSPQERIIIADTVKNLLYIGSLDAYLAGLKHLVRKGRVHPVLDIRTKLAAHLRENLKTLGLERKTRPLTLQDVLDKDAE